MRKTTVSILTFLLISFIFTGEANAGVVEGLASLSNQITGKVGEFTLTLYASIAAYYRGIYTILAIIVVSIVIYLYSINKIGLETVASFFIALSISALVALHVANFKDIIYDPFFDILYKLCAVVANSAGGGKAGLSNVDGIPDIVGIASGSMESFIGVLDAMLEKFDWSWSSAGKAVLIVIIVAVMEFMFIFLLAYFVVSITIAIFGIHMIMIFMPVTLSLFAFKSYRPYAFNSIKNILHYALSALFCCISMAISIFLVNDLTKQILKLESLSNLNFGYIVMSITTALFGFAFLKASSEFASRILNTVGGGIMTSSLPTKIAALTAGASVMKGMAAKYGGKLAANLGKSIAKRGGYTGLAKGALKAPFKAANSIKEYMQATKITSLNQMKQSASLGVGNNNSKTK